MPHRYLLDLSILQKNEKLSKEGDITGSVEVTVHGSCLMEKDVSREDFGFSRYVIVSTRGCTIVDKFIVIVLECIMTHSLVSLDMFFVCIVRYNDD